MPKSQIRLWDMRGVLFQAGSGKSLGPILTASPQPEKRRVTFFVNRIKQSARLAEFGDKPIEPHVYKCRGHKALWQRHYTAHALLTPNAVPQREIPYLDDTLMRIQSHGYGLRSVGLREWLNRKEMRGWAQSN